MKEKNYWATNLKDELSEKEKEKLFNTEKFMYVLKDKIVNRYALEYNLEKSLDKPILQMNYEEIEEQGLKNLPNMYYPTLHPGAKLEEKAAYFMLKNIANEGLIGGLRSVKQLYKEDKVFKYNLDLYMGR